MTLQKIWHSTSLPDSIKNFEFKGKVARHLPQHFMVPESVQHDFSVNEATWRISMNSCMWAAVRLHKDQDQIQRVLRKMDVEEIQQVIATTQNQMISSQHSELSRVYVQLNRKQSPWRSCTLLDKDIYKQFMAKVDVFSDSVLCLSEKCPQYSDSAGIWEQNRISNIVLTPERDQFQRAIRNTDVEEIEQIVSTTQHQIHSLQEQELFVLDGQLDWGQSPWKSCTLLHGRSV